MKFVPTLVAGALLAASTLSFAAPDPKATIADLDARATDIQRAHVKARRV